MQLGCMRSSGVKKIFIAIHCVYTAVACEVTVYIWQRFNKLLLGQHWVRLCAYRKSALCSGRINGVAVLGKRSQVDHRTTCEQRACTPPKISRSASHCSSNLTHVNTYCTTAWHIAFNHIKSEVFSSSFWMGAFEGGTPKRHKLWSNCENLLLAIYERGGTMTKDKMLKLGGKPLVKKYIDKYGRRRHVGIPENLRNSQNLGSCSQSKHTETICVWYVALRPKNLSSWGHIRGNSRIWLRNWRWLPGKCHDCNNLKININIVWSTEWLYINIIYIDRYMWVHNLLCQTPLPGPRDPVSMDGNCSDAELFLEHFMPMGTETLADMGDLWDDVPWNQFRKCKCNSHLRCKCNSHFMVRLQHFPGPTPLCPAVLGRLQILPANGQLGHRLSGAWAISKCQLAKSKWLQVDIFKKLDLKHLTWFCIILWDQFDLHVESHMLILDAGQLIVAAIQIGCIVTNWRNLHSTAWNLTLDAWFWKKYNRENPWFVRVNPANVRGNTVNFVNFWFCVFLNFWCLS